MPPATVPAPPLTSTIQQDPVSSDERSHRTRDLFSQATTCSGPAQRQRLYDELVVLNLPVADALARRYAARGLDLDDLAQVARLTLVRIVPQFRPEFGRDFLAYAVPSILGALRREFRDKAWMIRPPRRLQEAHQQIRLLRPELVQELGREPTISEVCTASGLDEETVIEALNVSGCFAPASLDRPVGTDEEPHRSQFGEFLGAEDVELERSETRIALGPILADLEPRDQHVLRLRYVDDLTQREVGEIIGVSQMQVSRILTRVLARIRDQLGDIEAA